MPAAPLHTTGNGVRGRAPDGRRLATSTHGTGFAVRTCMTTPEKSQVSSRRMRAAWTFGATLAVAATPLGCGSPYPATALDLASVVGTVVDNDGGLADIELHDLPAVSRIETTGQLRAATTVSTPGGGLVLSVSTMLPDGSFEDEPMLLEICACRPQPPDPYGWPGAECRLEGPPSGDCATVAVLATGELDRSECEGACLSQLEIDFEIPGGAAFAGTLSLEHEEEWHYASRSFFDWR